MTEETRLARRRALVELNDDIRLLASASHEDEPNGDFVCECGDADCDAHLRMPVAVFDALKRSGGEVLADGHPLSLARAARRTAQDLRESAAALQAQSRVQVGRARLLRGEPLLLVVELPTPEAGADLMLELDELAVSAERDGRVLVTVEVDLALADTLSHVRDWARRYGLAGVDVTFGGATRTLVG